VIFHPIGVPRDTLHISIYGAPYVPKFTISDEGVVNSGVGETSIIDKKPATSNRNPHRSVEMWVCEHELCYNWSKMQHQADSEENLFLYNQSDCFGAKTSYKTTLGQSMLAVTSSIT
jgi:hypothetical protein